MTESDELSRHQANGYQIDHSFTPAGCAFIIFTQATVMIQPGEKPLTNPAFWEDLKSLLFGRFFHNLHDKGQPASGPASVLPRGPKPDARLADIHHGA